MNRKQLPQNREAHKKQRSSENIPQNEKGFKLYALYPMRYAEKL
jgi:hypothetical protein